MRKQKKAQIQPRSFISQETKGRTFQKRNKWQHSQDAVTGLGKNFEGFSFIPASLFVPLPAFEAVTLVHQTFPIQVNALDERKNKATKTCPEIC